MVKVLADSESGEALLLVCRQLPSPWILTSQRERADSGLSSFNNILRGFNLLTSSKPNELRRAPPPNVTIVCIRASTYDWGRNREKNIQPIASTKHLF